MTKTEVCPGNLTPGFDAYSPACTRRLFNGKKVSHILDFNYDADKENFIAAINQISISGVQEKLSAIIDKGKIILTPNGKQGRYIIKPAPSYKHLRFRDQIPANEHLTMQIARQVYKINTADNAMIFFADGEAAYITKRFDFATDGSKIPQEDFSSLAHKSAITHGKDFKYTGSYEDVALLIRTYVSAWQVEISKLFTLVIFNYLFANGDAHLKNFSLQQTPLGDYLLSPAYDLMNTSVHVDDRDFALQGGLIPEDQYSETYARTGHPCKMDFITFGHRIGVQPKKQSAIITMFSQEFSLVSELIDRSFLNEKAKRIYKRSYQERLHRFLRNN